MLNALRQMDSEASQSERFSPSSAGPLIPQSFDRRAKSEAALGRGAAPTEVAVPYNEFEALTDSEAGSPLAHQQHEQTLADLQLPPQVVEFAAKTEVLQKSGLIYISGKSARLSRGSRR